MNNCGIKIRANNSHEKTEILDCFRELGLIISYKFPECDDFFFVRSNGAVHSCENAINSDDYEWVSLAQLKDRVVLHRNLPEDANYSLAVASDRPDFDIFKSSEGVFYSFAENNQKWVVCNSINDKTTGLKKLHKGQPSGAPTEYNTIKVEGLEGLVDGKAALTAALAGETVQISVEPWEEKNWDTFNPLEDDVSTKVFFTGMSEGVQKVFFRIKPKTILINGVEVPAPFKPKHSDIGFILDNAKDCYRESQYVGQHIPFGWWRTEEEIKQVVAALRKVFEVQS